MEILFVCTGNTCRSAMAEAIFNKTNDIEGVRAFSAGVSMVPGSIISKNSSMVLKDNLGLEVNDRKAVQITLDMVKAVDIILTMTSSHKQFLISTFPQYKEKIFTLKEFSGSGEEISDPYGGSLKVYNHTFNELEHNINLLIKKLKKDKGIN